ncbi:MAG: hypothetical protein JKY51_01720 [Opitutaceae bacterium]|nr:hypothetical protein [Opitutaceae bacterium]
MAPNGSSDHTILLADDTPILYRSGTERIVTQLKRYPDNPVISQDHPWEIAIGWSSIYRNPETGKYQLWYQGYAKDQVTKRTQDHPVCYAESDDGIHFEKPMFDLFPIKGSPRNNIVMLGNGGYSYRYGCWVVVDPHPVDTSRRYKMSYFDFSGEGEDENPGLHVAFSPDGIHWTKHPKAPLSLMGHGRGSNAPTLPFSDDASNHWLRPLTASDAVDCIYDPIQKVYAIYGKMWIDGPDGNMYWKHGMGRIESKDFINWSQPELLMAPDDKDPPSVEFHAVPVFQYQGYYFSLLQILNRATGGGVIDLELAISKNGKSWQRPFQNQFVLERGKGDVFDSGSIFTNASPVILNDEIRFYYGAYSGGATNPAGRGKLTGIGMASIPKDRFTGIRPLPLSDQPTLRQPLEHRGQITLKPIDLTKIQTITLNADASEGRIQVELLDTSGYRVRGYSQDDAIVLSGDSLHHSIRWKNHTLNNLPEGAYMLRIHLDHATAYAITLR